MNSLSLTLLVFMATGIYSLNIQKEFGDLDGEDSKSEDEFEKDFNIAKAGVPIEENRRSRALKKNEELVKLQNEAFLEGKKSSWRKLNDFDNLPEDEFEQKKTGIKTDQHGRGLLPIEIPANEESERYYDEIRYSRSSVPDSYSSVDEGFVTPVKNQKMCGSCV